MKAAKEFVQYLGVILVSGSIVFLFCQLLIVISR